MSPRRSLVVVAGLALVAGALAVLLVLRLGDDRAQDPMPGAGAEVAARTAATAYFTVDHRDAEATIDAVGSLATGAFAREYDEGSAALVAGIERQRLVSSAAIPDDGVAVASSGGDRATYLVAVDVSTEREGGAPQARSYRAILELALVDGAWKVSSFEEVP